MHVSKFLIEKLTVKVNGQEVVCQRVWKCTVQMTQIGRSSIVQKEEMDGPEEWIGMVLKTRIDVSPFALTEFKLEVKLL